jgi:hypothetical protein
VTELSRTVHQVLDSIRQRHGLQIYACVPGTDRYLQGVADQLVPEGIPIGSQILKGTQLNVQEGWACQDTLRVMGIVGVRSMTLPEFLAGVDAGVIGMMNAGTLVEPINAWHYLVASDHKIKLVITDDSLCVWWLPDQNGLTRPAADWHRYPVVRL